VASDVSEIDKPQEQRRLVSRFTRAMTSGARAAGRGTRAYGSARAAEPDGWPIRWSRWRHGSGCAIGPRSRPSFPASHPTRSPTR
jgi:hypothetical protein